MSHSLFRIEPNEIQRKFCVLHPEGPGLRLAEEEEHPMVFLEMIPVHESDGAFEGCVGDFGLDGGPGRSVNRYEFSSGGSGRPHITGE